MGGTCVTDQRKETLPAATRRGEKCSSVAPDGRSEPDTGSLVVASHMDAI